MYADLDRDVNLDIMLSKNHENPSRESSLFSFVPEDLWAVRYRNSTCKNGIALTFDNRVPVVKRSILLTLDLCGNETARWECVTSTDHISFTTILLRINYRVKWMPVFISPKALFHVFIRRKIPCESIHLLHILFCSWILYAKYMPRRPVFSQYQWQLFLLGVRWLLLIGFWLCIFRHFVSSLFNFICNFINISVYSMKK